MENTSFTRFIYDIFAGITLVYGLLRLLWIILWVSVSGIAVVLLWQLSGATATNFELFLMVGIPPLTFAIFLLLWAYKLILILLLFPFPECKQGKCQGINKYHWQPGMVYGKCNLNYGWRRWRWHHYWCSCGDHYVRIGRKFMSVTEDFETTPYKRVQGFRTWVDDCD